MEYQHKSGAQKRKEKVEKEKKAAAGNRTLDSLGFTLTRPGNSLSTSTAEKINEQMDDLEIHTVEINMSLTEIVKDTNPNSTGETQVHLSAESGSSSLNQNEIVNIDIGNIESKFNVENFVRMEREPFPKMIPLDKDGNTFPVHVLNRRLNNNEMITRDWLIWSNAKQALYCLPCRLFCKLPEAHRSTLSLANGWEPASKGYKKLYNRIPEYENSNNHKMCYMEWRNMQKNLKMNSTINRLLVQQIQNETQIWKDLLKRLLDVTLFLAERGLAFRGSSNLVDEPTNGNFLGILELVSHYDPLLAEHLKKVKQSQIDKKRLQVHYLSSDIQNEFISCCAQYVMKRILIEREASKYYSLMVDATPDSAHMEQTTFILRYVSINSDTDEYETVERFLQFSNCNEKSGEAIADLIIQVLSKHNIQIEDCRGQGYDNGSNMSGSYKGVQARLLNINPLAIFSPCACHSLNLCGVHAAEFCHNAITFFGTIQKIIQHIQ